MSDHIFFDESVRFRRTLTEKIAKKEAGGRGEAGRRWVGGANRLKRFQEELENGGKEEEGHSTLSTRWVTRRLVSNKKKEKKILEEQKR